MPVEIGQKYILQRDINYGGATHPFMGTVCAGTVVTMLGYTNDVHVQRNFGEYDTLCHGLSPTAFFPERRHPFNNGR